MAFQHTYKTIVTRPGTDDLQFAGSHQGSAELNLDESIEDGSDELVSWAVDVSQIKAIAFIVDGPCTIKTNSSSEPDNTLTFAAAGRYAWSLANGATEDVCLIDADVTALYVTTTGVVRLQIDCLIDATP